MTFIENVDRAVKAATCHFLANGGNEGLAQVVVAAGVVPGGQVPALGAGLGLLALNYGCSYDPNGQLPTDPQAGTGCLKSTGTVAVHIRWPDKRPYPISIGCLEIKFMRYKDNLGYGGLARWEYQVINAAGDLSGVNLLEIPAGATGLEGRPEAGATCLTDAPAPPAPDALTFEWQDTECDMSVQLLGYGQDATNQIAPIYKISAAATARNTGGIISGCNFQPFIYVAPPGGGGGGPRIPWVPGPDGPGGEPWWAPLVRGALAGAAGWAVEKLLKSLFPETLPPVLYRLTSVCETNAAGEAVDRVVEADIPQLPFGEGLDARLGALVDIAQGLKDFRQPTCGKCFQPVGDFATIHFVSEEGARASGAPLTKLFRYRDQAGSTLEDTVNHWETFSWQAGPVCVISKGLSWGTPQVWAATAEEGRRVIRHAAAIAGVDLDSPDHRWVITASADPRFGRAGTMRVRVSNGILQISKRPSPNGPPLKGKFMPAP